MEKRNVVGLSASVAVAAAVAWLMTTGDAKAVATVLDRVLLVAAVAALVPALAADAAPLARIRRPSVLALPAVVAGGVAALELTAGNPVGAITAGLVAIMFCVLWYRAEHERPAIEP